MVRHTSRSSEDQSKNKVEKGTSTGSHRKSGSSRSAGGSTTGRPRVSAGNTPNRMNSRQAAHQTRNVNTSRNKRSTTSKNTGSRPSEYGNKQPNKHRAQQSTQKHRGTQRLFDSSRNTKAPSTPYDGNRRKSSNLKSNKQDFAQKSDQRKEASRKNTRNTRSNSAQRNNGARDKSQQRNSAKTNASQLFGAMSPKAKIIVAVVAVLVLFFAADCLLGAGKIHSNVHIGDLNVGGMTIDEAASAIADQYSGMGSNQTIIMYESKDAQENTTADNITEIKFDYESMEEYNNNPPDSSAFSIDSSLIGANVDSQGLAQEAYQVGRGLDFVFGKILTTFFGHEIEPRIAFDSNYMEALTGILTNSLGKNMVNCNIEFDGSTFAATQGNDGYMVKSEDFKNLMQKALMGEDKSFVVPMGDVKMQIDEGSAKRAAEKAQSAIADSVELKLDSSKWNLGSEQLGGLVSSYVDGRELVPYISLSKVQQFVPTLNGIGSVGTPAKNVRFAYDGINLTHTEAEKGIGPNYAWITQRMNKIVFGADDLALKAGEVDKLEDVSNSDDSGVGGDSSAGENTSSASTDSASASATTTTTTMSQASIDEDDAARTISITLGESLPTLTYDQAHSMGLDAELIRSYSTEYASASSGKANNIELLSDILTNTVIAPGETFSINDTAGECNEARGFQEAGSIVNGEISSEIGGGICQVATTIFNAVFNAGYPIVERHNHSTYMASYPDGLDAAISWPYLDLKFTNDTNNYMILLLDHDGSQVTCSLWGISPKYTTDYAQISWEKGDDYKTITRNDPEEKAGTEYTKSSGKNGHTVEVQRNTYDKNGTKIRQDVFKSIYKPQDEIIIKGTKQ